VWALLYKGGAAGDAVVVALVPCHRGDFTFVAPSDQLGGLSALASGMGTIGGVSSIIFALTIPMRRCNEVNIEYSSESSPLNQRKPRGCTAAAAISQDFVAWQLDVAGSLLLVQKYVGKIVEAAMTSIGSTQQTHPKLLGAAELVFVVAAAVCGGFVVIVLSLFFVKDCTPEQVPAPPWATKAAVTVSMVGSPLPVHPPAYTVPWLP
jgi:hypothetical protein